MSYGEKHIVNLPVISLATAPGVLARYTPGTQGCTIRRVGFVLEVATSTTAAIIQIIKRPTPGSSAGQTVVATMTFDVVTAQGATVYSPDLDLRLAPGEEVVLNSTQAATGGTTTIPVLEIDPDWEAPGNFKAAMLLKSA